MNNTKYVILEYCDNTQRNEHHFIAFGFFTLNFNLSPLSIAPTREEKEKQDCNEL
jgi:hypothetical protein